MKQKQVMLRLAEPPFVSIQGEARPAGKLAMFIRLAGCNLACGFCDTKYSWGIGEEVSIASLVKKVKDDNRIETVIITGGEPLLQREALQDFVPKIAFLGEIFIETNGTQKPLESPVHYNVSPKMDWQAENGINKKHLEDFVYRQSAIFKFVARNKEDLINIRDLTIRLEIPANRVYIMPEGYEIEQNLKKARELVPQIIELGFNFSPRLHIWIWGNIKGV